MSLEYAIISSVRNEADALPRLADSLRRQTRLPFRWVIVESGSQDATVQAADAITSECDWARLLVLPEAGPSQRGAPIVRALHAGIKAVDGEPDVVVNVDADVTMEADYFERLLDAFERDPALGIASGSAWEQRDGAWRPRFVTGGTVWGATRAYRWACLQDVLPLEARHGWDGIDQLKARARGWRTKTFTDLPFLHHRPEGSRDGSTWAHWFANGDTAYFMGYRPWYLLARMLYRLRHDRAAFGLVAGYAAAAVRRSPRLADPEARRVLRADQSPRALLRRRREALGLWSPADVATPSQAPGRVIPP
jgi:glycosyltransferase involved in cell wall biosynthesis